MPASSGLPPHKLRRKHGIPYVVDVGTDDRIVTAALANTFRFSPGHGVFVKTAVDALKDLNAAAGNPAKTAIIVHEDSAFGAGTAGLLAKALPDIGIEVLDAIKHPTLDFNNIVLTIEAKKPDIVIPANDYNESVILARTMLQQKLRPKAIYPDSRRSSPTRPATSWTATAGTIPRSRRRSS